MLQDRWDGFVRIMVDIKKDGPSFISEMKDAGIQNAEGVHFTASKKSEIAGLLKHRMESHRVFFPHLSWEKPFRSDLCSELNVERYELRKDGSIGLYHPNGTHDDVFWNMALGVYAVSDTKPLDLETIRLG